MDRRISGAAREPPNTGAYVGKYLILGELGRGGMGIVYRALDESLKREVALKSPLPDRTTSDDRSRFLREARAASRVSHPHIVPVYEVFEEGERPWLAMELVDGRTLRAVLDTQHHLPIETVLTVGEQVADALDAAHTSGVLHRDVKPSNIMLTPRGSARLMDFGLARETDPPAGATTSLTNISRGVAGTVGYASPEQLLGRHLEGSSDLFSMGAVLYEMVTGRRAFPGDSVGEMFDATLTLSPRRLAECAADAPEELQRIIDKALAKRPDERYQSARDLAVDLRSLGRRRDAHRFHAPSHRQSWRVIGAIAVALVVFTAAGTWYEVHPRTSRLLGPPRQLTTGSGWEAEPAIAPDNSLIAYTSNQSGNADIWLLDMSTGASQRVTDDPAVDRAPTWLPDESAIVFVSEREGAPSIWKVPRLGGTPTRVLENADEPAVSPDGTRIAFTRRDSSSYSRICVAPLSNPDDVRVVTGQADGLWDHAAPAWSPDGQQIIYSAWRDLWIASPEGGKTRRLTFDDAVDFDAVWSPDGNSIYFSSNREGIQALWQIPSKGGRPIRLTDGQGPEGQPALSHDGLHLVYSTYVNNRDVVLRDLKSGREDRIGGVRTEQSPAFSPDGKWLAFVSDRWAGRYDLWIQPIATGHPVGLPQRLTDHPGSAAQPAFSPDGKWIAYYRVTQGQRDIWIVPSSGGAPRQFTNDPAPDVHPTWSPDGSKLAFVSTRDGQYQIWIQPVADGKPAGDAMRLTSGSIQPAAPSWSPDGAVLSFLGRLDNDIWIVPANGTIPPKRITHGADAMRLAWDRSSNHLWANAFWGEKNLSLRTVDVQTGEARPPFAPVVLGADPFAIDFDISPDGKEVAFVRQELRGNLWVHTLAK